MKLFTPFKPHIYEKDLEKILLSLDITRLVLNITMAAMCCWINLHKMNKDNWISEIQGAFLELGILILFSTQVVYLFD